jgi:hypothetical protein
MEGILALCALFRELLFAIRQTPRCLLLALRFSPETHGQRCTCDESVVAQSLRVGALRMLWFRQGKEKSGDRQ